MFDDWLILQGKGCIKLINVKDNEKMRNDLNIFKHALRSNFLRIT